MAKTGDGESLGTAEGAVLGRAMHTLHAERPVLNDTWAVHLLGAKSQADARDPDYERRNREATGFDSRLILAVGIGSLRYAEDEVERAMAEGIGQYVIMGAGFDTFALRRADAVGRLEVFEIDFPDVQALKRERIDEACKETGAAPAQRPTFVPVDFESMTIREGLLKAGFDPEKPSVWSWMNTIPYLTNEATEATLTAVQELMAPKSRLVLNYQGEVPLTPAQIEYLGTLRNITSQGGEPMKSRWKPDAFEAMLAERGLRTLDHSTEADLNERYYKGRTDGLYAAMPARLVTCGP